MVNNPTGWLSRSLPRWAKWVCQVGVSLFTLARQVTLAQAESRRAYLAYPYHRDRKGCQLFRSRIVELLEATPGDMFDAKGQQGAFPDTKLVYWCGGNIYHHHQDLNRLNRAWSRPETIIVHEPFWTPMAKRADIVLPATTPLERRDLGNADDLLLAVQPVHEPYENARDDYAIFSGLAQALGFGEQFTEGRSADEWVEHLYELFRAQHNDAPTFEEFLERGTLELDEAPMGETEQDFLAQFRADPKANPLSTPSGLIELYSETINSYEYDDCPPHPVWLEPYEWRPSRRCRRCSASHFQSACNPTP